jgi:hypothetical protein
MFEVADQDGDGKLMYEELFAILTAMNDEVRPSHRVLFGAPPRSSRTEHAMMRAERRMLRMRARLRRRRSSDWSSWSTRRAMVGSSGPNSERC